jgi:hypothetical protein
VHALLQVCQHDRGPLPAELAKVNSTGQ